MNLEKGKYWQAPVMVAPSGQDAPVLDSDFNYITGPIKLQWKKISVWLRMGYNNELRLITPFFFNNPPRYIT